MKDAAKLLAYLAATVLFAIVTAPLLFWGAEAMAARGVMPSLAEFGFERFFRRAVLVGALLFFWPLLRWLGVRNVEQLGLTRNEHRLRDLGAGFLIAAIPLLCFGGLLLAQGIWSLRETPAGGIAERVLSSVVVPFIEEPLFRGLILGVLLRSLAPAVAVLSTSAFFSILHFLKAADDTVTAVTWTSGFNSIGNALAQFSEPLLVLAGFTTLFLLGWILADARIRTRSLWLPIGLHSGWIFASAMFNQVARREMEILPWLGRNLLIGLAPLAVALLSWWILRTWLKHVKPEST
ncbi:hypothetical protein BH20VER1_BH20VER1_24320 [soil metagenome]